MEGRSKYSAGPPAPAGAMAAAAAVALADPVDPADPAAPADPVKRAASDLINGTCGVTTVALALYCQPATG